MAAFGLRLADAAAPPRAEYDLWPQNVPVWYVWLAVQTQWRYAGMDGVPTGLDYAGVRAALVLQRTPRATRPEWFALLQHMEAATLDEWARKRERDAARRRH